MHLALVDKECSSESDNGDPHDCEGGAPVFRSIKRL